MNDEERLAQAERRGTMTQRMNNMADDIDELKTEQKVQGERQVKQGEAIASLNVKMIVAGALGGLGGSLLIGLILLFAQKGAP